MVKKVVIIGPESTGKSSLCAALAQHYQALWCPEYAREYLLKNGARYTYPDLQTIAGGQLELEDRLVEAAAAGAHPFVFIDTDMYVMKVWSEFVFGKCDPFILNAIAARKYDLYLLCNTDLPWAKDELREYPDLETRDHLFTIYKAELTAQQTPWAVISGTQNGRTQAAITAIDSFFK
ncbi:MAG: ATP-binding protein [Niabella sp.]|nr:ATP-binding protein [Niabella sp.]